jgi:hypothetical protein
MGEGEAKMYYSRYAYVMRYEVKHKNKPNEEKYFTITSHTKMNKRELKQEIIETCMDQSEYDGELVKNSIQLVAAYENQDW